MVFVYVYMPLSLSMSVYELVYMCIQMSRVQKRVLYSQEFDLYVAVSHLMW